MTGYNYITRSFIICTFHAIVKAVISTSIRPVNHIGPNADMNIRTTYKFLGGIPVEEREQFM
jgi:hypothetical protein